MTFAQLWTNTRTSISWKICCVKSEFQILYAVEQFSSLFSKDKLKQGAHIHQTHDLPYPRMSWENCRAVPCQQLPHVLCGAGTERTHLGRKGSFIHGFSLVTDWRLCPADEPQTAGKTGVHGCHCPRDIAVHMREVLARPWVDVCVPLALSLYYFQCNQIKFTLFFISYCISWHF